MAREKCTSWYGYERRKTEFRREMRQNERHEQPKLERIARDKSPESAEERLSMI